MEQALKTFPLEFEAFQGDLSDKPEIKPPTTVKAEIDVAGKAEIDFDAEVRMPKNIDKLNSSNEGSIFFLIKFEIN